MTTEVNDYEESKLQIKQYVGDKLMHIASGSNQFEKQSRALQPGSETIESSAGNKIHRHGVIMAARAAAM